MPPRVSNATVEISTDQQNQKLDPKVTKKRLHLETLGGLQTIPLLIFKVSYLSMSINIHHLAHPQIHGAPQRDCTPPAEET